MKLWKSDCPPSQGLLLLVVLVCVVCLVTSMNYYFLLWQNMHNKIYYFIHFECIVQWH